MNELERLRDWAVAQGAQLEAPTNPYELLRLRVVGGVAIVYTKKNGQQTYNDIAVTLRGYMNSGQPLPGRYAKIPLYSKRKANLHRTLIARDGEGCFFCLVEKEAMTLEHLVALAHKGPNHVSNLFRACQECNVTAGHLSAPEKIRIREANLIERIKNESAANQARASDHGKAVQTTLAESRAEPCVHGEAHAIASTPQLEDLARD